MSDDALLRRWAENWERAGKVMEAMRRHALEAMTDEDVRRHVADIFSGPYPYDLPPRTESGLVEQQRLFAKLRTRE